ncbi:hypothetical protein ACLRDC_09075 [Gluconacetobacter sacchari]|uniref:hypothetical protein n=1 Tax=Gluconacetobacter sacchari TaxID=92759 RepID=UPI00278C6661|nr:hypothetical protein [Gluconacetobacter sacchari]
MTEGAVAAGIAAPGPAATGATGAATRVDRAALDGFAALAVRTWGLCGVCAAGCALWAKAEEDITPLMAVKARRRTFFRRKVRVVIGFICRSPMDFSRILT